MPNETINVAPGTYKEDVIIGKPLSLVGTGPNRTVIDATGLSNGIYVDGLDNAGLSNVVVTGFTVKNAEFEGILVTNASFVTITNNKVTGNDTSLDISTVTCPGLAALRNCGRRGLRRRDPPHRGRPLHLGE